MQQNLAWRSTRSSAWSASVIVYAGYHQFLAFFVCEIIFFQCLKNRISKYNKVLFLFFLFCFELFRKSVYYENNLHNQASVNDFQCLIWMFWICWVCYVMMIILKLFLFDYCLIYYGTSIIKFYKSLFTCLIYIVFHS